MASSIIILTILILIILAEMYYMGKYISTKQEMFTSNRYASFSLGFVTYFLISFAVFFIFIFFKLAIIYFVVFFGIKDVVQILYLLTRREVFSGQRVYWKEICIGIVVSVGALCLYNFVANKIEPINFNHAYKDFQSWYKFQDTISKITLISNEFIYKWFGGLLVTFFGYSTVMAFITHFSKKVYWWTYIFGFFITTAMIFGLSFGKHVENSAGVFLILFAVMSAVNIIVFSRRRYATAYGMITITAWSFNQNLVLALLMVAFVTLVIYTILQKPKVSMFWVQLMAPLALVSTFWINDYSRPLGLAISIIAILSYTFMVSIGRVKMLDRLNDMFIKMRYVIPLAIFIALMVGGIVAGVNRESDAFGSIANKMTYLFYNYESNVANYVQIALYSSLIAMIVVYLLYNLIYKKKLIKTQIVVLICSLMILFALNPALWLLFEKSPLEDQFKYLSASILPPLVIVGFTRIHTIRENKKITFV